ncbi:TonB-dependent receptor domain-containing protein [Ectothiorhodospira lacustris]|uniref:TonB-dependent receptor domain-containing protein n=1 Tax=Ectothiorhodospira lacustris TaxID=2899127 RepID=UPI001EE926B6|nr:TonB-dependent receptor [Ectothiorhodospira lacustris]MCG5511002.1 TonB-dependent receptor [Ectothiorhodospira lacustris]MCG5522732.1 TonB-dependent receptor [Ectothiorhodospira lacustris]
MHKKSLLSAAILLALPHALSAQEMIARLDPILVTPTRTAQTVDQTLASVTVIEREEIERLQPKEFADLLRARAGIGLSQNGPFGKTTSLFMRGTNSSHTLLLIDGVRMGSATLGSASWQFLPPAEIERVEIVRGPRTSLYGSDAIGGVVQIFTRDGDGPARVRAHMGGGSFNTREYGLGVSGSHDRTRYSLSGSHFSTDGIDVQKGVGDSGRDGFHNSSLSGRLSHQVSEALELFGSLHHARGETDYDFGGPARDWIDFVHHASRLGVRGQLHERWFSELSIGHSRDENETFQNAVPSSQIDTVRYLVAWQNDILLGNHLLTAGLDYQDDQVKSATDYDETRRDNWGVYAQLQLDLGRHALTGSLRQDDNESFGRETTGQLAWGYRIMEAWQVRASGGTAFKAPTFNDLYWPGGGNPDLAPESSETFELGLRHAAGGFHADLAVFQSDIDDLIEWAPVPGSFLWQPQNVEKARIRGVELETGIDHDGWSASLSMTWLDHENRRTGNELRRRPNQIARLDLDRQWQDWSLGTTLIAEGRRYNDDSNSQRIAGHELMHLRAAYRVSPAWTVRATLNNVFDRDYVTARQGVIDYEQPGRAFYLTLNYQQ